MIRRIIFIFFLVYTSNIHAQTVVTQEHYTAPKNREIPDDWQPGYIILQGVRDTLHGYLKIKSTKFGHIYEVKFRKNKDVKKGTLKIPDELPLIGWPIHKDTLEFFGIKDRRYKYIDEIDLMMPVKKMIQIQNSLMGWAEILEQGAIHVFLGFEERYGNNSFLLTTSNGTPAMAGASRSATIFPTYCLTTAKAPAALIQSEPYSLFDKNFMNYKVNKRNKKRFVEFISDYAELAEKVKNSDLYFGQIENYVHQYNQWAKNNK